MSTIAHGALINLVVRLVLVAMGFAITVITARLGTTVQGAFALFTAVESAILMLGSGFGVALARRISHHGERPVDMIGSVAAACAAMGLAVGLGLWWFSTVAPKEYEFLAVLALGAPLMLLAPNLSGIWLGTGNMEAMGRVSLMPPILTLAGIGLSFAVRGHIDLQAVLWSWVAARIVVALGTVEIARRSGWIGRPRLSALQSQWGFVGVIGLTNLVGILNYKVDLFLVERLLGLEQTGVYSVAVLIAELLWLLSSSITQAAYGRIGQPDAHEASRVTLRAAHASLVALGLVSPLLWIVAAWLLPVLFGPVYRAALVPLALLMPGVVVFGAASALSAYFTNHAGRPHVPAALAALSLVLTIVVSLWLIPMWGTVGAALATSLAYGLSIVVAAGMFCRLSGVPLGRLLRPDWTALRSDLEWMRSAASRIAGGESTHRAG
jgi:O-antigen/teichoic acid export membrane protein